MIWMCGLSGAGKTTFAKLLVEKLKRQFSHVVLLDGDVLRGIYKDFNYTKEGRLDLVFRSQQLCMMLADSGCIVVIAVATMQKEIFLSNRKVFRRYFEVLVQCSFEALVQRDQKQLYSRALRGEIQDVYGVDIPCDFPKADYVLENSSCNHLEEKLEGLYQKVMDFLLPLPNLQSQILQSKVAHTPTLLTEAYCIMRDFRPYLCLEDFISRALHLQKTMQWKLVVFYDGGELVGLCGFMPSYLLYHKQCLFISDFVVAATMRGRGYGRKMLLAIEEIAWSEGFNEIALESGITMQDAHKSWVQTCGFVQTRLGFKKDLGK